MTSLPKFLSCFLLIVGANSFPNPVHAFGLSDLDPTNPDSAVRDAATEIDPANPDAFVNQGIPGKVNPLNPESAINGGLTELDPTDPNSVLREAVSELDPTDPNSAVGEVADTINPVSTIGEFANEQLATAGQDFRNGFIEPTKQLLLLVGGGILFLMLMSTLFSKLGGKKST